MSKSRVRLIALLISVLAFQFVSVSVATSLGDNTVRYELFFELDFLPGHVPTQSVLDYIEEYYFNYGIRLIFVPDDISYEDLETIGLSAEDYSNGINDEEFWQINMAFNDHNKGYYSSWKWILFGNSLEDDENTAGRTLTISNVGRVVAGNYIFIADEIGDQYARETPTVEEIEVEAVVLMHEIGHSIGVLKVDSNGNEVYDDDVTSVMSRLNPESCNAVDEDGKPNWHYSDEYWSLRFLDYYRIRPLLFPVKMKGPPILLKYRMVFRQLPA